MYYYKQNVIKCYKHTISLTAGHHRVERNRDKPMPAPRKPKPPPPYRSTEGKYQLAVEESTRHSSPLLRVPVMNAGKVSCDQPRKLITA